ncbi:MAG: hydroxyacid dehydrogenase [Caulobacter sp.]|nr:hydroxyacid dehydrogenase [Caulobacter sp.]
MKIVVYETEEWERAACLSLLPGHDLRCRPEALTQANAGADGDAEAITTFIKSDLRGTTLRHMPGLKLIATRSTGYDHIDLHYCRAAGIAVCNVPDYGDHTVAEHAFALLLALTRHIVDAAERTRRGDFSRAGLRGMDLAGKTLGVIGAGRIGRRAITIGRGFGMEVLACDLRPDPSVAQALGFRYADLDEVLRGADVLTLHVPGGVGSSHLISDDEFAAMRPGALLVNTARGGVVDPEALVRALASGKLGGAALDVLPEESVIGDEAEIFRTGHSPVDPGSLRTILANHALLRFPNVIVTPHIAYDTREALERIVATTVANIEAFARGAPGNLVS